MFCKKGETSFYQTIPHLATMLQDFFHQAGPYFLLKYESREEIFINAAGQDPFYYTNDTCVGRACPALCVSASAFNPSLLHPGSMSAFSWEWKSTGSLPSDWHVRMLPGQDGHVGNVAGHHCQMAALSTCWFWSLQAESRKWHRPSLEALCSSALPGSKSRIHFSFLPASASLATPSSRLKDGRWGQKTGEIN